MRNSFNAALVFAFLCAVSAAVYFFGPSEIVPRLAVNVPLMLVLPLVVAIHFRMKKEEFGASLKEWRKIILYTCILFLVAIPGMLYAAALPEFQQYYPRFFAVDPGAFLGFELMLLPLFLSLEFLYRGFALFQMKKFVGNYAILLQAIPYALIHLGKPLPELFYSFFAGIVFAYVCIKAKSFLPAFGAHYSTSAIFDLLTW